MVAMVMLLVTMVTLKYTLTMATMQMVYKFEQSDAHMLSKNTIIKILPVFNSGCHGNHCGRLHESKGLLS